MKQCKSCKEGDVVQAQGNFGHTQGNFGRGQSYPGYDLKTQG